MRDFTIENILIYKNYEGENTILIDDFGIISILNSIATKIEYKSPYMSPELLKGSYY